MTNALTAFSSDYSVAFNTKTGVSSISVEGAIHKGGAALLALKEAATDSAIAKAVNGRYTAAVDVLGAAFPKVLKDTNSLVGMPALNKHNFATFITGIGRVQESIKGFSKKQVAARLMAAALRSALGIVELSDERTVEMA